MTEQERIDAFGREFNALVQRYGVALSINLVPKPYGPMLQVEAATNFVTIPDWKDPGFPNGSDRIPRLPYDVDIHGNLIKDEYPARGETMDSIVAQLRANQTNGALDK